MPRKRTVGRVRATPQAHPLPDKLWEYLSDRFDFFGGPGNRSIVEGGRGVQLTDEYLKAMWQEHREGLMAECERRYGLGIKPWPDEAYDRL